MHTSTFGCTASGGQLFAFENTWSAKSWKNTCAMLSIGLQVDEIALHISIGVLFLTSESCRAPPKKQGPNGLRNHFGPASSTMFLLHCGTHAGAHPGPEVLDLLVENEEQMPAFGMNQGLFGIFLGGMWVVQLRPLKQLSSFLDLPKYFPPIYCRHQSFFSGGFDVIESGSYTARRLLRKLCTGDRMPKEKPSTQIHNFSKCLKYGSQLFSAPLFLIPKLFMSDLHIHQPCQKTSAVEMCTDAAGLLRDGTQCKLAELMESWLGQGHEERSFERCLYQTRFVPLQKMFYSMCFVPTEFPNHIQCVSWSRP